MTSDLFVVSGARIIDGCRDCCSAFTVYVGKRHEHFLFEPQRWVEETFQFRQYTISAVMNTPGGWMKIFWFYDKSSAVMFKLRWMNSD